MTTKKMNNINHESKPNLDGLEQCVGYQEVNITEKIDHNIALVWYLNANNIDGQSSISLEKCTIDCKYTEDEIKLHIKDLLRSFPIYTIPPFEGKDYQWEKCKKYFSLPILKICNIKFSIPWFREFNAFERYYTLYHWEVGNKIAQQNRRGVGNIKFNNTFFYKGTMEFDCPIIVVKNGDLYGIFKHPNFDQYGFNLIIGE